MPSPSGPSMLTASDILLPMTVCVQCGESFSDPKHPGKQFCSIACRGKARRKRGLASCAVCGTTFEQRHVGEKTCSNACARVSFGWKGNRVFTRYTVNCAVCSTPFETVPTSSKQRTCSRACQWAYKRAHPRWPEQRQCVYCGTEFLAYRSQTRYCSRVCGSRSRLDRMIRDGTIGTQSRKLKARLLAQRASCHRCGWSEEIAVLEAHHVDRNRKNNREDNLILLCPNCHSIDHYRARDGQFKSNIGRTPAQSSSPTATGS